ncbi:hypothetical protein TRFO_08454 [Tritrichomonas foetus]|uniref:Importin N-terminal domain-containing protein n=1 Tax=Tritrichomonas foetus TaxID=1144522 RepID=A0A1J4JKP8_9EUKA|nr:hypothetical protein TRFO_08454 [Tritrichomonas foetus]|eukprot:OHS99217.1 hypothetical protein TRFO_08454 [Tritrichomonas foetus]
MNRFEPSSIEEAIAKLGSSDLNEQNAAGSFLYEWFNNPIFFESAFFLLQNSNSIKTRQVAAISLSNAIIDRWNSIPEGVQNSIRFYLLNRIPTNDTPQELIITFNRIIVIIALYEFPQKWNTFFTDFLNVDPSSPHFLRSMCIISQYLSEVEDCNFLTHERLIQLESIIFSFKDQLLHICNLLMNVTETAEIGINILMNLLRWGEISEILTEPLFLLLLTKNLIEEQTAKITIDCLSVAFFDRFDIGPIFDRISISLVNAFSSLQRQTEYSIGFITKFLRKYICFLEAQCFPLEMQADSLSQLIAILFHKKTPSNPFSLVSSDYINQVRKLFECTLIQMPDETYVDDFWLLWRDIARKIFCAVNGSAKQSMCLELIRPILPILYVKTSEFLPDIIQSGCITNPDTATFFEFLVRSFPMEMIHFISSQSLTPALVYTAGFLKCKEDRAKQFINEFSTHLRNLPPHFYEALLFFYSRVSLVLQPQHFNEFIQLCSVCLMSQNPSFQFAASNALYVSFNIVPQRIEPNDILSHVQNFAISLSDKAIVRFLKLASYMTNVLNFDYTSLSMTVLSILGQRTEVALESIVEMANSAREKCFLFFHPLWKPLFELIEANIGFEDLIFKALAAGSIHSKYADIHDQIITLMQLVFNNLSLKDNLFEYFAIVRQYHPEYDSFYPQLEELIRRSEPSVQMFYLISQFSPVSFDMEMIISKILEGSKCIAPDLSKEALQCARSLLNSFVSSEKLSGYFYLYRRVFLKAAVSCLMDTVHHSGFSKQSMLINDIFVMSENLGDTTYLNEFVEEMKSAITETKPETTPVVTPGVTPEITPEFFISIASHLNANKACRVEFKEALRDLLIVLRKATPYQMRSFFEEETKNELNEKQFSREEQIMMMNDGDELPMDAMQALTLET